MPGNTKGFGTIDRVSRAHTPVGIVLSELGEQIVDVFAVVKPLFFWPMIAGSAVVIRQVWPASTYVMAFFAFVSVLLAWFTYHLTWDKDKMATGHAVFSVLAVGALLCYTDMVGWHKPTVFAYLFGVFILCASWSMRAVVKNHAKLDGAMNAGVFHLGGMSGTTAKVINPDGTPVKVNAIAQPTTLFKQLSDKRKAKRIPVTAATIDAVDAKPSGKQRPDSNKPATTISINMNPGDTIEDLKKRKTSIESAAQVPPGTLLLRPDMNNASMAMGIVSDPRSILAPIPYLGPSWIDGSVADAISTGVYQDGTEVEWDIIGLQIQIMGMTGSGKSLGAAWSTLAELITRHDVFVWGVDVTKGQQTLGPLGDSLHRLETEPAGAMQLLTDVNTLIKPRTNYLSNKGLGKWERGCGLQYGVIWLEEVPDIMAAIGANGVSMWLKSVKAARSAGLTIAWSLQRSDATQVPTLARGQAAKWCFGVSDNRDKQFGLSSKQKEDGCTPELWANRYPGTSYLDAPSIGEDHISMAQRAWYWGENDSLIKEHANNYQASERPYDALTEATLSGVMVGTASPSVPLPEPTSTPTAPTGKTIMDPTEARDVIRQWIKAKPSGAIIKSTHLADAREPTGYGRQWSYKVMDEMETEGLVIKIKDGTGVTWHVK